MSIILAFFEGGSDHMSTFFGWKINEIVFDAIGLRFAVGLEMAAEGPASFCPIHP